jgi:hypothetical protein
MKIFALKITFILFVFFFTGFYMTAQEFDDFQEQSEEEALYYIHQKTGTEELLKKYIASIVKNQKEKTEALSEIYLNFIPPMICPRCEGLIDLYNQMLKEETSDKAFIVNVLLYKKPKALSQYIQTMNFSGDILVIDTTNSVLDIFAFNNNKVIVPYVAKISIKEGRLISARPTLGIHLDQALVKKIIDKKEFEPLYDVEKKSTETHSAIISLSLHLQHWNDIFSEKIVLFPKDSCIIPAADTLPELGSFQIDAQGNQLLIKDFLSNTFLLYSKKEKQWDNPLLLSPSSAEKTMFIAKGLDTSYLYYYLRDANVLVSMYLNALFTSSNIYLYASLPKLIWEGEANVGYYNAPVCMIKNRKGENLRFYTLDGIQLEEQRLIQEGYSFSHSTGLYFEEDSLFVFQVEKGWPAIGTEAFPQKDNILKNPFLPEFYNQTKTVMMYHHHDNSYTLTAPLDSLYEKYKLGYYVSSPIVKKYHGSYYVADKYIGKIKRLSEDFSSSIPLYDLFSMDTVIKQMPMSEDVAYMESYRPFFKKTVEDFLVFDDNSCYAIVSDAVHYYLFEAKGNKISAKSYFPEVINGLKLAKLQFGYDECQKPVIYGLYQNNQRALIYTFNI